MHVSFIPYGHRQNVERYLRYMEAEIFPLAMTKGKKKKTVHIYGQLRILPFGIYEYVFPKGMRDVVLTTLKFGGKSHCMGNFKQSVFRKMIKHKKVRDFDNSKNYRWNSDHVAIIPIGEKTDGEVVGWGTKDKGWTHEAI